MKKSEDMIEGLVSIILPTYNGEKYIGEAIESIIGQTYKKIELIIVNDASTDQTASIISKYAQKDSRIKVINNDINMKLPKSLNIGFGQAKGEYYTWTSDDNVYHPTAIAKMKDVLVQNPNVGFVFARQKYIDDNGKKIKNSKKPKNLDLIYVTNFVGGCFLYKQEVDHKLNGYDESRFLVEDYDFILRAYKNFEFMYLSDVLYGYRCHEYSLTSGKAIDIRKKTIELLSEQYADMDNIGKKNCLLRGISKNYILLSNLYLRKMRTGKCSYNGYIRGYFSNIRDAGIKKI